VGSLFTSHGDSAKLDSSTPSLAEAAKPGFRKAEKYSENALRSVSELHVGDEKQAGSSKFDMVMIIYLLPYGIRILPHALIFLVPYDRKK
jgi:hypothetical protein